NQPRLSARQSGFTSPQEGTCRWLTETGDIGGGQRAGLRTIWLRGRSWPDEVPAAHHVVDDVTEAITILLNETE
ncbi:HAD family hydrolase, partial [Streptomyces sp. NPDC048188]